MTLIGVNDGYTAIMHLYASRVVEGKQTLESVPEKVRKEVAEIVEQHETFVMLYVAQLLEGKISILDVPMQILDKVKALTEDAVGKSRFSSLFSE